MLIISIGMNKDKKLKLMIIVEHYNCHISTDSDSAMKKEWQYYDCRSSKVARSRSSQVKV